MKKSILHNLTEAQRRELKNKIKEALQEAARELIERSEYMGKNIMEPKDEL